MAIIRHINHCLSEGFVQETGVTWLKFSMFWKA